MADLFHGSTGGICQGQFQFASLRNWKESDSNE
jgi:hypothetical protein